MGNEKDTPTGTHAIEKWYSGKALATLKDYVLPTLDAAAADGFWPKGASRKIRAALNKQTVAIKFANKFEDAHGEKSAYSTRAYLKTTHPAYGYCRAMMFGSFERATELAARSAGDADKVDAEMLQWAADFAPVAELVALLDATRPKPVLLLKTLSPTVLANVAQAMGVDLKSIEVPEIVYEWTWIEIGGRRVRVATARVIWPEGTRHNVSRFITSEAGNSQCHACGHAIRNGWNWVPLIAQTTDGPVSLWVGKDCAKNLFGCVVDGDADWSATRAAV